MIELNELDEQVDDETIVGRAPSGPFKAVEAAVGAVTKAVNVSKLVLSTVSVSVTVTVR